MDRLERVLTERSSELIQSLTGSVGFSSGQAELFLREAGPELVETWRWQASDESASSTPTSSGFRNLLALMNGRTLAPRVGLSSARTWEGLRALVVAMDADPRA